MTDSALLNRATVLRLYPNRAQAASLRRWQGGLRFVWNMTWAWCKAQRDAGAKWPNKAAIQARIVAFKKHPDTVWLTGLPAHALLSLGEDMHRAMHSWFEKRTKMPKFRGKYQRAFSIYMVNQATTFLEGSVKLPKLGAVKFRGSDLPAGGRLLSSRVYRKTDKWFMAAVFECQPVKFNAAPAERVGVDMGVKTLATAFDGERVVPFENVKALRKHEQRLRRYQRVLSRRKKGSHRREAAKRRVARLHQRIAYVRKDVAHKASTAIVDMAQTIVVEDLNITGMLKNHRLAKSIADASMSEFLRMLRYKAEWKGRTIVTASRWFPSSKTCSVCGEIQDMPLKTRWYSCACGNEMDRDENAARNLQAYRGELGNVAGRTAESAWTGGDQARQAIAPPAPREETRISKQVTCEGIPYSGLK